ncbi:acyl carrier protein [Streptomyces sp. NRRL S-241]|uniref:acyl carrier protein n=1 Tax=Streptomyces sp. NRRL S-241 TaxID=1463896 RepID=UPI0009977BE9|nr:acyl carrier protein [Streptomyces sp. NRRL S-241]
MAVISTLEADFATEGAFLHITRLVDLRERSCEQTVMPRCAGGGPPHRQMRRRVMADAVYERLVGILDETFRVEPELIQADATLADMEFDSLAVAELAAIVQEQFGVKLGSEDVGKEATLGEVARTIGGRTSAVVAGG